MTQEGNGSRDWTTRIAGDDFRAEVRVSPFNQRLQVLSYRGPSLPDMVAALWADAEARGFGKLFMKAAATDRPLLEASGMEAEASIEDYFGADDPAVVMSAFLSEERRSQRALDREEEILERIRQQPPNRAAPDLPTGYSMAVARPEDADELAALYREVFASYPFPITDPRYLVATMESRVVYRIVRDAEGSVVAAASGEMDPLRGNAEMTDFATLPSQRGLGLAQHLLAALEDDMRTRGVHHLYTIARARSAGMNRVFYNRGYELTGTLVNNCHIAGRFEDMHVWCRPRSAKGRRSPD